MVIHQASVQNSVEALGLGDIVNANKNSDKKFVHVQQLSPSSKGKSTIAISYKICVKVRYWTLYLSTLDAIN